MRLFFAAVSIISLGYATAFFVSCIELPEEGVAEVIWERRVKKFV